jgi:hypothetical protein
MPPLTEFHLFPKLPLEIRLTIWEYVMPGPPYILTQCRVENVKPRNRKYEVAEKLPVMAVVCGES